MKVKELSYDKAAEVGKFSQVTTGKIKKEDLSWIEFPKVNSEYYFKKSRDYRRFEKDDKLKSKITLKSKIKLNSNLVYDSIKDLEIDYFYYSYSQERYVRLKSQVVKRSFSVDTLEEFEVEITDFPLELIDENYFRRGEFIISELRNFYIPKHGVKYSDLMKSVNSNCLPVFISDPLKSNTKYVAVGEKGEGIASILNILFPNNHFVQDNEIVQIDQFSNNLGDFEELSELKMEDKAGKWFILTDTENTNVYDYRFKKNNFLSLSYLTGKELSSRKKSSSYLYEKDKYFENSETINLGAITKNSEVNLSFFLENIKGVKLNADKKRFSFKPPRCRNCSGTNWSVSAEFQINKFENFIRDIDSSDLQKFLESYSLSINNNKLIISELIKSNNLFLNVTDQNENPSVNLKLVNLEQLDILKEDGANFLKVEVKPLNDNQIGQGVHLSSISGKNIDRNFHAGLINFTEAAKRNLPIAVSSWGFDKWKKNVPWGKKDPRGQYTPVKGELKRYFEAPVLDIAATITNFYN